MALDQHALLEKVADVDDRVRIATECCMRR
jgi:hypothetical protein